MVGMCVVEGLCWKDLDMPLVMTDVVVWAQHFQFQDPVAIVRVCCDDGSKCEYTFFTPPRPVVLTLFRLLITSVFRLMGRERPCSLRNSPHALHSTDPFSSRRHNGVVDVEQF